MQANISVSLSVKVGAGFLILCALVLGTTPRAIAAVSFADYMPLTPAQHGVKTFEWTYGRSGQFTSWIAGTKVIHYGDGTSLTGIEITNTAESGTTSVAYNDGTVVKLLGTPEGYLSSDPMLTSHPAVWSFSSVDDGMVIDQRPYYVVKEDRSQWSLEDTQMILFDVQDVTVSAGKYCDSVIQWTLDTKYPFTSLDLARKRSELGINVPSSQDTKGFSVTEFVIFGFNTGMIAWGDIDARSGELLLAAELEEVGRPHPFGTSDLAGTWSVHGIVVGKGPSQHPGWFHCQITFDANGRGVWSPIIDSGGNHDYVPEPVMWTIDADGVVSMPGGPPFHGVMNQKRDRVVAVATMTTGSHASVQGDNLIIMQKQSGVAFATSDLAGTWSECIVQTGVWQGWMHGDTTIDPKGALLDVPGTSRDSSGVSPTMGGVTMSLTSEGVVGVEGYPVNHGTLSGSKDVLVCTYTMENAYYGLCVNQRRADSPFVKGDLSGVWRICGLSTQGGTWTNWVHGTWMVNADGSSNGLLYKSDGTASPIGGTVTMANYGVFRIDPFNYTRGVVGSDRDLIVLVTTDSLNEHQMLIGTRADPDASFVDYMPVDPKAHGIKTFQWTYGRTGQYTSRVSGPVTIYYGDGSSLTGVEITNLFDSSEGTFGGIVYNDGLSAKILGINVGGQYYYMSSDAELTGPSSVWSFGCLADGMMIDQRGYYQVDQSRLYAEKETTRIVLCDIQDVKVLESRYDDAIIMWDLDSDTSFTPLQWMGKDADLGIVLPTASDTAGYAVTSFWIFGRDRGLIAIGDHESESGRLIRLAELRQVQDVP